MISGSGSGSGLCRSQLHEVWLHSSLGLVKIWVSAFDLVLAFLFWFWCWFESGLCLRFGAGFGTNTLNWGRTSTSTSTPISFTFHPHFNPFPAKPLILLTLFSSKNSLEEMLKRLEMFIQRTQRRFRMYQKPEITQEVSIQPPTAAHKLHTVYFATCMTPWRQREGLVARIHKDGSRGRELVVVTVMIMVVVVVGECVGGGAAFLPLL